MEKQDFMVERFRSEVYRIGWRLQYHEKKQRKQELSLFNGTPEASYRTDNWDSRILVKDLLLTLPKQGRTILYKLYVEDLIEKEVALQLNMSQQAVNKWKRKMLQQLLQTVNF
ncbi:sigma factor-like helix-turn-helix DNA-binding protein [Paenibacillus sp. An7]|uniref:sigma factor-like helix-turn-helix DNA-binding protein n=1 Tax=Paenibacillus sp. An7 TaxID=2689577 RepID=UPI001F1E87C7|nr:sigma factor-like helix-turn-helix DNA-binding protein [Paenibacillus sp. An7]